VYRVWSGSTLPNVLEPMRSRKNKANSITRVHEKLSYDPCSLKIHCFKQVRVEPLYLWGNKDHRIIFHELRVVHHYRTYLNYWAIDGRRIIEQLKMEDVNPVFGTVALRTAEVHGHQLLKTETRLSIFRSESFPVGHYIWSSMLSVLNFCFVLLWFFLFLSLFM